jgi:acetyl/propionyl-CoA carboxylase alpha subunit
VASGAPLGLTQDQIVLSGHAIEARVVAEDPGAGWLPSTGRIERFAVPDDVRCDTGITEGSEVGADYDSLLAKVVVHATDRSTAVARLGRALASTELSDPAPTWRCSSPHVGTRSSGPGP